MMNFNQWYHKNREKQIRKGDSGKLLQALAKKKLEITRDFQRSLIKSLQIQKLLSMIEREGFVMDIKKNYRIWICWWKMWKITCWKAWREPPSHLSATTYENQWTGYDPLIFLRWDVTGPLTDILVLSSLPQRAPATCGS